MPLTAESELGAERFRWVGVVWAVLFAAGVAATWRISR